jgi:RHS repeat-associated protein
VTLSSFFFILGVRVTFKINRLQQVTNPWGDRDISRFSYDGDGNRIKMTVDVAHGPNGRGNSKGQGNGNGLGNGNGQFKCGHVVPPGFVPPGLAKKCGQGEQPYPDEHPGGPRDGWETQHKKKHWEFHYTNDISLALPEVLQVTEDDATKWKESFVYGAGRERISMTYLPAYDHDNGWDPTPGAGGADPDVTPKTLYYMTDIMGSTIGLLTQDGRLSARYHYDEFGMVLDSKKFDVNWPGPDNLYGYTGLEYDYYTDLNYARARYYKPEIGRFISEDTYKGTLWNTQSQNLYTYVYNNPLIYTDPSGHNGLGGPGWKDELNRELGIEPKTILKHLWES